METTWLETIIAALIATLKFALTVPFFIIREKLTFWESLIFGISSGTFGIILFMFLSARILNFWEWFKTKTGLLKRKKPKKVFTKRTRRWVKFRTKYGLVGIALASPFFLSLPVGCFLAVRYYKNKREIFLYMFGGVVIWSFVYATFGSAIVKLIKSLSVV